MKIEFASVDDYARQFTDTAFWRPAVERVCQHHNIHIGTMQAGLAGTHPVFLVQNGQQYVIKFYETRFFAGTRSYKVERELYQWLPDLLPIAIPRLIATGILEEFGTWPYIITTRVPGTSFGQVRQQVDTVGRKALATVLGRTLSQLHRIPVETSLFLRQLRDEWSEFIRGQYDQCVANHQRWNTLPNHLIAQIPDYLAKYEHFGDPQTCCLIHADLTEDHVLGAFQAGQWSVTGLIDFGDAWVGSPLYELVALHLSVFQLDKGLLQTFLQAYTSDTAFYEHFVERAMVATLLFEFNAFADVAEHQEAALKAATLEELADQIWGL